MKKFILVLLSVLLCLSMFSCEGDVVTLSSSEDTLSEVVSEVSSVAVTSSEEVVFEFSENPDRCVNDNITRQVIEQAIYFHNPTEIENINKDDLVLYCQRKLYSLGHIKPDQNGDFMLSKEIADKYLTAHFALEPFVWEIKYPFNFQTGEVLAKGYEEDKNAYNLGEYDNAYSPPWIECEVVDCVIKGTSATVTLNVYKSAVSYYEDSNREYIGTFTYRGNLVNTWENTTTFQLVSIEETAPSTQSAPTVADIEFLSVLNGIEWETAEDIETFLFTVLYDDYVFYTMPYDEYVKRYTINGGGMYFPAKEMESFILKYFDISVKKLRSDKTTYLENLGVYETGPCSIAKPQVSFTESDITQNADIYTVKATLFYDDESQKTETKLYTLKKDGDHFKYLSCVKVDNTTHNNSTSEARFVKAQVGFGDYEFLALDSAGVIYGYKEDVNTFDVITKNAKDFSYTENGVLFNILQKDGKIISLDTRYETLQKMFDNAKNPLTLENVKAVSGDIAILEDGKIKIYVFSDKSWHNYDITPKQIKAGSSEFAYIDQNDDLWIWGYWEKNPEKIAENVINFDYSSGNKVNYSSELWYITKDQATHLITYLPPLSLTLSSDIYSKEILNLQPFNNKAVEITADHGYFIAKDSNGTYIYGKREQNNIASLSIKAVSADIVYNHYAMLGEDGKIYYGIIPEEDNKELAIKCVEHP